MRDTPSLRTTVNLASNALHKCIGPKGTETQVSDAMRACRAALDAQPPAAPAQDENPDNVLE